MMPTARELLEQADALMKRNRSVLADDIPVLTEVVPAAPEARVLRGRGALSRTTLPPLAPDAEETDSIPTLTERVDTDAPDPQSLAEEGEPSDWLQEQRGEPSVTGEVPDSVLIVPPPEEVSIASDAPIDLDDLVFDDSIASDIVITEPAIDEDFDDTEEIELSVPVIAEAAEDAFDAEFAAEPVEAEGPVGVDVRAYADVPPDANVQSDPSVGHDAHVRDADEDVDVVDTPSDDIPATAAGEPVREVIAVPVSNEALEEIELPPSRPADSVMAEPAPAAPAAVATAAVAPIVAAVDPIADAVRDDARWEGVAEEIRMQVLQRIDIFTDTGLREQLGVRLQPIVDRASADLVATINQHVGELLRTYVAEAIEREIESWRRSH